jgi:hypothetical protein
MTGCTDLDDDDDLAALRAQCYLAAALLTALGDSLVPRSRRDMTT